VTLIQSQLSQLVSRNGIDTKGHYGTARTQKRGKMVLTLVSQGHLREWDEQNPNAIAEALLGAINRNLF
jgi:hypothetical protein